MNKKLLAPAIVGLLACGAACAEAGLTLYGNIDASVVTASGIGNNSSRRTSFGEGNWAPSVWGLKGSEDLGGGMKAHVSLEGGFNAGNGGIANGGTTGLFSRLANVGLSGSMGSLSAGLNQSPFIAAYTSTLALSGNNFYVPALQMHRGGTVLNSASVAVPAYPGGTDADPGLDTTGGFFIPNSVIYTLPSELLKGAAASVLYSFGGVPGSFGKNRFVSGNIGYAWGDVTLFAAISDRDSQYRQWLLGAGAPVGPLRVAANFVRFNPETGERTQTYTLGASMQVMPNSSVGVNYARNDGPGHPSIMNVSAVYAMSKTMNLYAAFNRATEGVPSSYSAIGDAAADPTLTQTGTSNAVIVGLQKGF